MSSILFHLLNAVQLAMMVYLLAVGLTLIFGLMDTLNLGHGAFYTLGAYAGYLVASWSGSFWLAFLIGPLLPFAIGFLMQYFLLYPLVAKGRSSHLDMALLTFGFLFVTMGAADIIFGADFMSIDQPDLFQGALVIGDFFYPKYRLFVIGLGVAVAVALWLILERTVVGASIRAGVDDREMVVGMGLNIRVVFAAVFGLGSALAGLAGVVSAPVLSIYSHMGINILLVTFIVVIVGGLGNLKGSFYGAIIVGLIDTFTQAYLPQADLFAIYIVLILVMIFKPEGLFANEGRIG